MNAFSLVLIGHTLNIREKKVRAEIISQNSWELTLSKVLICQLILFNLLV
jgi:hypothetical protein